MNLEKINEILANKHVLLVIITIIISIVILKVKSRIFNKAIKKVEKTRDKGYRKVITYIKLTNHIINYIIIIIATLFVLQLLGFNVSSVIAGVGIVSAIVGLSLQDALKDIIMGFNIIIDSYFSVGDVIKIDDVEGKVIELGVKSTKLKDVNTENVLVIANRNIVKALRLSEQLIIDIPIPYEEKTDKIETIIDKIVFQIKENKEIRDAKYLGINEFADSAVIYRVMIWCQTRAKVAFKKICIKNCKNNIRWKQYNNTIHTNRYTPKVKNLQLWFNWQKIL